MLWSFEEQRVSSPALFDAFALDIVGRIDREETFSVDALTGIITSFAKSGVRAPALYDAVARRACATVDAAGAREIEDTSEMVGTRSLVGLAWSYAIAGVASEPLFDMVASTVPPPTTLNDVQKSQLHQVALFVEHEAPHLPQPLSSADDRALCKESYVQNATIRYSASQNDVSSVLRKSLHWAHESEFVTDEGISLDMASPEERFAVEFDGPSHFATTAEGAFVPNGRTLFKQRVLQATGWELFSVPWYEYRDIPYAKRADFLRAGMERMRTRNRRATDASRSARDGGAARRRVASFLPPAGG